MRPSLVKAYFSYRMAADRVTLPLRRRRAEKKLRAFSRPYRLHLGCGPFRFDGWVNIDADASHSAADVLWDLVEGIPVADSSCRLIYSEHLLEHLKAEQGVSFLRECRRVLEPGGVMRVAMPSLDDVIDKSCKGNWREQDWLTWPDYQFVETRAEMLNIAFRWWGHQWLYDREELHRRLREAGWSQIKDVGWGDSAVPELRNREIRKDSLLICEARK